MSRQEVIAKLEVAIDEVVAHVESMGYAQAYGTEKRYLDGDMNYPYLHMNQEGIEVYSKFLKNLVTFSCIPYSTDLVNYKGCVVVLNTEALYMLDEIGRKFIYEHELTHFMNNDPIIFTNKLMAEGEEGLKDLVEEREAICDIRAAKATGINIDKYNFIKVECSKALAASLGGIFNFTAKEILDMQKETRQYKDTVEFLKNK